jgi:NTE family protein
VSNPAEKSVHVVLGGGGTRCIAYIGALRALNEKGYSFASISACSAGTVIAALLCGGMPTDVLERLILQTDLKQFEQKATWFSTLTALLRWPHAVYRKSTAADIVRALLGSDPELHELYIPFATIGVDLVGNSFVIYSTQTKKHMRVSEAVSIATAIPFAYPPYQKDGRIVVDASVATQCPIWLSALQQNRSPIFAFTSVGERSVEIPRNFADYLGRILFAGAESGDEAMLSIMPRLHRIEIHCPKINSLTFALSLETKRALLIAGSKAILTANLEQPAATPLNEDSSDKSLTKSVINNYYREVIMNNSVNVGGSAIINIDSVLSNVQQTLQQSAGLTGEKKSELENLVAELRKEIEQIKVSHAQEATLITQRLQEVVQGAAQEPQKRNSTLLNLSGKGLVEAAETVGKIMPKLLTTAQLIAKFIVGL